MLSKSESSFTLIECLVSIIILAVLLTAGMAFYFNAQEALRGAIHKRIAVEMASAEMESIKNTDYANISLGTWPQSDVSIGNLTGKTDVDVSDMGGFKQVHVVVSWQDAAKSASQNVSIDTYIAP